MICLRRDSDEETPPCQTPKRLRLQVRYGVGIHGVVSCQHDNIIIIQQSLRLVTIQSGTQNSRAQRQYIQTTHNQHIVSICSNTQQHSRLSYTQPASTKPAHNQPAHGQHTQQHAPGSTRLPSESNDAPYCAVVLRTCISVEQSWTRSWGCPCTKQRVRLCSIAEHSVTVSAS